MRTARFGAPIGGMQPRSSAVLGFKETWVGFWCECVQLVGSPPQVPSAQ